MTSFNGKLGWPQKVGHLDDKDKSGEIFQI